MARKSILSTTEQNTLIAFPTGDSLIQYYTLNETDLALISQRRSLENRLGFAIQLCYMRYPGIMLSENDIPNIEIIDFIANQLSIPSEKWVLYGSRKNTIHEHRLELQTVFGFKSFTLSHYRKKLIMLKNMAMQTDKGILLATTLIENLHEELILLPPINVIDRLCSEAITKANRKIYQSLTESLSDEHYKKLDNLLKIKPDSKFTWLIWLRQSPSRASSIQMLEHIERLNLLQKLNIAEHVSHFTIHQNRLLKIAREGEQMTAQHLMDFENKRRYATLVAIVIENTATITDEIIDLHALHFPNCITFI